MILKSLITAGPFIAGIQNVGAKCSTVGPLKALNLAGSHGSLLSNILPTTLSLSGGSAAALDLTRVKTRLEGLSSYGVVTALIMNAGLRLYSSTPKQLEEGKQKQLENAAKIMFCFSVVTSIVAGAYTSVVFSLLGLYAKTALGLGMDEPYLQFMEKTACYRQYAFDSFVVSLVTFEVALTTSLFINYRGSNKTRWLASGISLLFLCVSYFHWSSIMSIARDVLFSQLR